MTLNQPCLFLLFVLFLLLCFFVVGCLDCVLLLVWACQQKHCLPCNSIVVLFEKFPSMSAYFFCFVVVVLVCTSNMNKYIRRCFVSECTSKLRCVKNSIRFGFLNDLFPFRVCNSAGS